MKATGIAPPADVTITPVLDADGRRRRVQQAGHEPRRYAIIVVPRLDRRESVGASSRLRTSSCAPPTSRNSDHRFADSDRVLDDATHDRETVVAAVERERRFVALHVGREEATLGGRHVGSDGGDHVDCTGQVQRCGEVTDHDAHVVVRHAPRHAHVDVHADDTSVRTCSLQPRSDRATAGAEIDGGSVPRAAPQRRDAPAPRSAHAGRRRPAQRARRHHRTRCGRRSTPAVRPLRGAAAAPSSSTASGVSWHHFAALRPPVRHNRPRPGAR